MRLVHGDTRRCNVLIICFWVSIRVRVFAQDGKTALDLAKEFSKHDVAQLIEVRCEKKRRGRPTRDFHCFFFHSFISKYSDFHFHFRLVAIVSNQSYGSTAAAQ